MARRRVVDRHKLALIKAADIDNAKNGFDWSGLNMNDPKTQLYIQEDHRKGVCHFGLECCQKAGREVS